MFPRYSSCSTSTIYVEVRDCAQQESPNLQNVSASVFLQFRRLIGQHNAARVLPKSPTERATERRSGLTGFGAQGPGPGWGLGRDSCRMEVGLWPQSCERVRRTTYRNVLADAFLQIGAPAYLYCSSSICRSTTQKAP